MMNGQPLDNDIASLGRVSLQTWRIVVGLIVWAVLLSAAVAANTKAISEKADRELVEVVRKAQIELLSAKIDTMKEQMQGMRQEIRDLQGTIREKQRQDDAEASRRESRMTQ